MKKGNLIILVILVLAVVATLFIMRGDEDTWLCQNGEWIKHGNPDAEKPNSPCGIENNLKVLSQIADSCKINEGSWLAEQQECEQVDKLWCEGQQGFYSECESGCRHNDDPFVVCTAQCVGVCYFSNQTATIDDLIELNSVRPNDKISSPLILEGQAVGNWYFEGDFPVILTDWDGLIIAEGYLTAQSDWMTEDFVQFKGSLEFVKPNKIEGVKNWGSLILQKDNPSGLPENDNALEITIFFE